MCDEKVAHLFSFSNLFIQCGITAIQPGEGRGNRTPTSITVAVVGTSKDVSFHTLRIASRRASVADSENQLSRKCVRTFRLMPRISSHACCGDSGASCFSPARRNSAQNDWNWPSVATCPVRNASAAVTLLKVLLLSLSVVVVVLLDG